MDSTDLIKSLVSEDCPGCDGKKKSRNTFCNRCYFKLSKKQRADLYKTVGNGYEEAHAAAMKTLKPGV